MANVTPPPAPWALAGELVVAAVRRDPRREVPLPGGLPRRGRRSLVVGARIEVSPVGPFLALVVVEPARMGLRAGSCITTFVVDEPAARLGLRQHWGMPAELGTLRWNVNGDYRRLAWTERHVTLVAEVPPGRSLPLYRRLRLFQRRADGRVVVHGSSRGRLRLVRVELGSPDRNPLGHLAGSHRGVWIGGAELVARRARRPVALAFTQEAPGTAPEPALAAPLRAAQPAVVSARSTRTAMSSPARPR